MTSVRNTSDSIAEKLYKMYPRRVGKPMALKAIEKALRDYPEDYLIERVQAYAALWKGVSPSDDQFRFIPHASTWFNQERFQDEHWAGPTVVQQRNTGFNTAGIDQYR